MSLRHFSACLFVALALAGSACSSPEGCVHETSSESARIDASALVLSTPTQKYRLISSDGTLLGEGTGADLLSNSFPISLALNVDDIEGSVLTDRAGNVLATGRGESTSDVFEYGQTCQRTELMTLVLSPAR